ncbi:MAG TPA: FtsQ-type POTRA domain-containing protein [Atribacterota bacterium]|nr:FtsQ-type POTRA domain-containing protein [Atribacterota bacterium]
MILSGYRVTDNYENEEEILDEDGEEDSREYNLFRVLLFYIIVGFLSWNIFYFVFTSSWFDIKRVTIHGNNYLDSDTILTQGELDKPVNIFHFNTEIACQDVSRNPWVKEVTMKKIYPNQVDISIVENKPGALLYSNDLYYLITAEGMILSAFSQFHNDFNQYIITGLDIGLKKPGETVGDIAYQEVQRIIYVLNNIFPEQFYKIGIISKEEFLLFHKNNNIKVRIESGEQLIREWYLLESALQKVTAEKMPSEEINMKYKERLLIILPD